MGIETTVADAWPGNTLTGIGIRVGFSGLGFGIRVEKETGISSWTYSGFGGKILWEAGLGGGLADIPDPET